MPAGLDVLQSIRLTRIMRAIQDVRELPADLVFLGRTSVVPALDGEIMGRYVGRVQIADLVADDAQALTYVSGHMTLETTTVPNIKHGATLTQAWLNQLAAMRAGGATQGDGGIWSDYENQTEDSLLLGIRQRMEALIVAMACDSLSYDRFGITLSAVTWGMPADLKITVATAWTDAANATPVQDLLLAAREAQVRYGIVYRRVTLSLAAFLDMIATTEFQNQARMFLAPNVSFVNLVQANTDYMRQLAANVLGFELVIYDQRYWTQDETGARTSAAYLPINLVILDTPANDHDLTVTDFANGVVTESIVAGLLPNNIVGQVPANARGPISYATAPPDLNPPNVQIWGVARGFPRKHLLQANAVLTVGNLVDPIPVGEPF